MKTEKLTHELATTVTNHDVERIGQRAVTMDGVRFAKTVVHESVDTVQPETGTRDKTGMKTIHLTLLALESSRDEINEPIGIGMVAAAALRSKGASVRVEQFFPPITGLPGLRDVVNSDILGISMPLGSLAATRDLVRQWRTLDQRHRPILVFGGLLPTFATDEVLTEFPDALLVIGEGEEAIQGIVQTLATHGTKDTSFRRQLARNEVPNLVYSLGGRTMRTPRRNIVMDNAPRPRRELLRKVAQRGGIVRAEASRGCSWGRCTFCAIQHKYCGMAQWRTISIAQIVRDLEELSAAGVRHPYFTDEDFLGNDHVRGVELAEAIIDAKDRGSIARDMTLYVDMRVASILQDAKRAQPSGEDVLKALRTAGLREVFIGIESGAKQQVHRYKKPATATRNQRALQLLRALSISVDIGFIFFDPEMSLEEANVNLDFLRVSGLWTHDARMTKEIRVETGTPLAEEYRAKGLLTGPMDIDELTFPYRWLDPRVRAVHDTFRVWENETQDAIYRLQSNTRGEVASEELRKARRDHLGLIRGVEHDALAALVRHSLLGKEPRTLQMSRFSERRRVLLETYPNYGPKGYAA